MMVLKNHCGLLTPSIIQISSILTRSQGAGRLYLICTEYLPSSRQPQKGLYNIPPGSAGQRLQPPLSFAAPLTHIAFQKIYLERCTTATRGKGKRSKTDTIRADMKEDALNTGARTRCVRFSSPFDEIFKQNGFQVLTDTTDTVKP